MEQEALRAAINTADDRARPSDRISSTLLTMMTPPPMILMRCWR